MMLYPYPFHHGRCCECGQSNRNLWQMIKVLFTPTPKADDKPKKQAVEPKLIKESVNPAELIEAEYQAEWLTNETVGSRWTKKYPYEMGQTVETASGYTVRIIDVKKNAHVEYLMESTKDFTRNWHNTGIRGYRSQLDELRLAEVREFVRPSFLVEYDDSTRRYISADQLVK